MEIVKFSIGMFILRTVSSITVQISSMFDWPCDVICVWATCPRQEAAALLHTDCTHLLHSDNMLFVNSTYNVSVAHHQLKQWQHGEDNPFISFGLR